MNHKRVYRIVKEDNLLLPRKYSVRPEHVHDGKVIVMRSKAPMVLSPAQPLST